MTERPEKIEKAISPKVKFITLPRMLTVSQAAWYMGISPKTIRNGICRGADKPFPVKPKRHGKRVLFDIKDIDSHLDSKPHG